jgi:hypothetical protein
MSLSAQDLFLAMRSYGLAFSDLYAPEAYDTEGQDVELFLRMVAAAGEELSLESTTYDLGHFLSTVGTIGDEQAERLVSDLTGGQVQRFRENAAVVDLQLSRMETFALEITKDTIATTSTDSIAFRMVDGVAWATDEVGVKIVRAICESTGPVGNVDANTITKISIEADNTVSCTNPTPASGGRVLETIPELAARARDWFVNAPRGTLSAIEYGAKQTPGVVTATGIELTRPLLPYNNEIPAFRVKLAVGDVSGQAGTALVADVRKTLQEWRGAGIPVLLVGSLVYEVKVKWVGLKAKPNFVLATIQGELSAKMVAFAGQLGPDVKIERADLFAIAKSVDGFVGIPADSLEEPADDVTPPGGYTNRIRAKDVQFA